MSERHVHIEIFDFVMCYGLGQFHLSQDEFRMMPFGLFMDLWECHRQYNGISKLKQNLTIDEIIPYGICDISENFTLHLVRFRRNFFVNILATLISFKNHGILT